jgi:NADP-dependent 3-hydroxy acid dehydrogenase YdfG
MALLDNKICIITGGAGSLGLASARLFLGEGARVMLIDKDENALIGAQDTLGSQDDNLQWHVADVANTIDTKAYLKHTIDLWGQLDVLFCNAGVSGVVTPVEDYPEDEFDP